MLPRRLFVSHTSQRNPDAALRDDRVPFFGTSKHVGLRVRVDENRGRGFLDGKIASLYRLASSREGARLRDAFEHGLKPKRRAQERQATKLKTMKRSFDWVKPGEKTTPISSDVGEVVRTDESE